MAGDGHWTYAEWLERTIDKIAVRGALAPVEHREDWLRIQVRLALRQALAHGRSGLGNNDPVVHRD